MACQNAFIAGVSDRLQIRGITDNLSTRLLSGMIRESIPLSHFTGPNRASGIQAVIQRPKNIVNGDLSSVDQHGAGTADFKTAFRLQSRSIVGDGA
jgi:hypothetical protein